MRFADSLNRADIWLLDKVFQPLADRLGESPSAFDVGLSLQLGAVVFQLAADLALYAAGVLDAWTGLYDGLSCACGVWFYVHIGRQRSLVQTGRLNPLRLLYQALRLFGLGFALWSVISSLLDGADAALSNGLSALSNIAFVAGLYMVSCQPRPPAQRRRATRGVFSHGTA